MKPTPNSHPQDTLLDDSLSSGMVLLQAENNQLKRRVKELEYQLAWFKRQLFGATSEKRRVDNPKQEILTGLELPDEIKLPAAEPQREVTYLRGVAKKKRSDDDVNDCGLRFGPDVPVEQIEVIPPELKGPNADRYTIVDTKTHFKLAQRPGSYVVLQYNLPVVKEKASNTIKSTPMPAQVFEGSLADVSFIAGLLVDKFQYHLPLHRQHQRLTDAGITMARSTLTNLVKRGIELLRPIHDAQLSGVLHSHVLAMDETPIKAGREPKGGGRPGKMQSGWIWPIYGDQDEIVFTYSKSRSAQHIRDVLANNFSGVLLSDGYSAYASYVAATELIEQAQCWAHTRRGFERAEKQHPQLAGQVLDTIAALYRVERQLESLGLTNEAKREYRQQNAAPIVSRLMAWAREQLQNNLELTPGEPITKALKYMVKRETQLSVFLKNPAVSLDTNHLERGLRPIPMGRKNWMFCWTEIGAEHVGIIQSLIATCKIHGVNPTHYLIDVLQRVSMHPSRQVAELTPRRWKELFADERMISFVSGKGMQYAH